MSDPAAQFHLDVLSKERRVAWLVAFIYHGLISLAFPVFYLEPFAAGRVINCAVAEASRAPSLKAPMNFSLNPFGRSSEPTTGGPAAGHVTMHDPDPDHGWSPEVCAQGAFSNMSITVGHSALPLPNLTVPP